MPKVAQLEMTGQDLNPGGQAPLPVYLNTLLECVNTTGCTLWNTKVITETF